MSNAYQQFDTLMDSNMTNRPAQLLVVATLLMAFGAAHARVWTDSTGHYTVEADLIVFNDRQVVLQRKDGELGAVPMDKLSTADRDYLMSKEAEQAARKTKGAVQTWKLRSGNRVVGRVVDYARKEITLQRRRGKIYVNDRVFDNLPEIYQRMLPGVVGHFEKINKEDAQGLEAWLVRQKGQPRSFTIDGVVFELENGDEYVVPFFLFSDEDQNLLQSGWQEWLAAHQDGDYQQGGDHAFMLESLAAARHRDEQVQRRIATMQLGLEAVQAGVTSLWEVTLYPARGTAGPPLWVVVPGRDSAQATSNALSRNPGYTAGPVRRVSNRYR
jgi:SLA1 homology domain 1, SHD1